MDVLYDNMSLPDLIKWEGIEAVKQVMGKNLTDERIGEIWGKCRNCFLPDYKTWQKNYTETEKNLAMMNKVSEESRAACLWNWNCEEQQWQGYDNGVKPTEPTELCFCKLQAVSF